MAISDRVIHTGLVDKEELVDFYNLADLFVFPSLYEGFGIPPLEAMACGTPVIAADNSSIPEVVGDAAVLFNGNDAMDLAKKIDAVLNDAAIRDSMVTKGKMRSTLFSWNRTVDEIKKVLERC